MQGVYEMTSVSSSTLKQGHGMIDCGATASAAQKAAVTLALRMGGGEEPCIN